MTTESTIETLTNVFREIFDDDTIEIRRDMTAGDIDGWDSLTHIRLIIAVERAFGVRIPSTKIANLNNVGDLIDAIQAASGN
jgi:acyl carrier protein